MMRSWDICWFGTTTVSLLNVVSTVVLNRIYVTVASSDPRDTQSPSLKGLSMIITIPDIMLATVSFAAKDKASPITPTPANSDLILICNWSAMVRKAKIYRLILAPLSRRFVGSFSTFILFRNEFSTCWINLFANQKKKQEPSPWTNSEDSQLQ